MEPPWVGGMKVCSPHLGHMTKMAATPLYGKNPLKIFFSGTTGLIFTKLGMYYWGLQPIIDYSNDDPGLTLTYFTARSNFETLLGFSIGKIENSGFFRNYCSLLKLVDTDNS